MSKLSELLNPIPSSQTTLQSPPRQHHAVTDDVNKYRRSHSRYGSISTPLEALAIVATTRAEAASPPLSITSPIAPTSPFAEHNRSNSNSSSRPSSSHYATPISPTSHYGQEHMPPPRLDHTPLHATQNRSRRLSDIAEGKTRSLPPLVDFSGDQNRSLPPYRDLAGDQQSPSHTLQSYSIFTPSMNTATSTNLRQSPPVPIMASEEVNDAMDVDHSPSLSSAPQKPDPAVEITTEPDVTVKKEQSMATPTVADFPFKEPTPIAPMPVAQGKDSSEQASEPPKQDGNGQSTENQEASLLYSSTSTQLKVPSIPNKKRAAPKSDKKVEKKGIASAIKKPAAKKRKVDQDSSKDGTPFSQRSQTPLSSRASKTPAPASRRKDSSTPAHTSSPAPGSDDDDDDGDDGDSAVFCICRKPDDHTWMIGCDGGCEDWFHGRCVKMDERDGNLIDKYICPNCERKGVGRTTWKPMCRLQSCRNPARATGPKRSKYCSDEHGREYMRKMALVGPGTDKERRKDGDSNKAKKRRKESRTDHDGNDEPMSLPQGDGATEDGPPDEGSHLRGGILRAGELKALTNGTKDITEFRALGQTIFHQGDDSNPEQKNALVDQASSLLNKKVPYNAAEKEQLASIEEKKVVVKRRRVALEDREKFVTMVKARAKTVLEELKAAGMLEKERKDLCGYDSRLTWSDEEFEAWRNGDEGRKALESGILLNNASAATTKTPKKPEGASDGDVKMTNGGDAGADDDDTAVHVHQVGDGVCQKKRCERHKTWFKIQTQDIATEKDECRQEMRSLANDEKDVRERAMVRWLEAGAGEDDDEGGDEKGNGYIGDAKEDTKEGKQNGEGRLPVEQEANGSTKSNGNGAAKEETVEDTVMEG
ncbi:hypothetical protein MMC25_000733 [Agyrium rufum]|nr:hypothetical protein [Agyrium rufum]